MVVERERQRTNRPSLSLSFVLLRLTSIERGENGKRIKERRGSISSFVFQYRSLVLSLSLSLFSSFFFSSSGVERERERERRESEYEINGIFPYKPSTARRRPHVV